MAKIQKVWHEEQGERFGLFGASGSGKTTKLRKLIAGCNRLVVFDSLKGEWTRNCKKWLGKDAISVNPVKFYGEIYKKWHTGFKIVVMPSFGHEIQDLHHVCSILWCVQGDFGTKHAAKITLVVDEAQEGAPAGIKFKMPTHAALRLATMGRGRGINLVVASQRIKSVDINIRSNLTGMFIFRLSDLADIQEAKRLLLGKGDAGSIPNYSYYYKDENGQITFYGKK